MLDSKPNTYHAWAEYYYEHPVSVAAIERVYAHHPLTNDLIAVLNHQASMPKLLEEAKAIGYN